MKINIDKIAELSALIKEKTTELNKEKSLLKGQGKGTYEGEKYKAVVQERVSTHFKSEEAIKVAKEIGADWLVKTVEVLDEEKLKDALFTKELDASKFADCISESTTFVVSFKKKNKN